MDLGISLLTDDQIVELLMEVCHELVNRDPVVRKSAQIEISRKATELKILRKHHEKLIRTQEQYEAALERAVIKAVMQCRSEEIQQLEDEVAEAVRMEVAAGRIRLMSSQQEAEAIVEAVSDCGEVIIHVCPSFTSAFVANQLSEIGVPSEFVGENSLRAVLSSHERQIFLRIPGAAAHRIEVINIKRKGY